MRFGGANKLNRKSGEKAPSVLFCAKEPVVAEPRWKALEINHYRPTYASAAEAPHPDIPSRRLAEASRERTDKACALCNIEG
jgi:hypothetical protein